MGQGVRCDAMATLNAEPLLDPLGQDSLLQEALYGLQRNNSGDALEGTSASSRRASVVLGEMVGRMQGHAGNRQVQTRKATKPIKERLKKARQRIDWASYTAEWVLFDDVLTSVKTQNRFASKKQCYSRATQLWEGSLADDQQCFKRNMYDVNGWRGTQAEVYLSWQGFEYDRVMCEQYWAQDTKISLIPGETRPVDRGWKRKRMMALRPAMQTQAPAASDA